MANWLNNFYSYRRPITVYSPVSTPFNHPVRVRLPRAILDQNKTREDWEDLEVTYWDGSEETALYREIEVAEDAIYVNFVLQEDIPEGEEISDTYFIYYGNPLLEEAPERQIYSFYDSGEATNEEGEIGIDAGSPLSVELVIYGGFPDSDEPILDWPVVVPQNSGFITYTRIREHWMDGITTTPLARANLTFWGTKVRIVSETGVNKGIMEVRVDDEEWEQIDLYALQNQITTVYVNENLSPEEEHNLTIRSSGDTNPASLGNEVNIVNVFYVQTVIATDEGEQSNPLLRWAGGIAGGDA